MKLTPRIRRRLYEIAIAALAIVVFRGLLDAQESVLWLALIAATLGVARVNVQDD